jgi:diguanylate cyclase (GGDEF)-like protein
MNFFSRRNIGFRLLWVFLAICVVAACGYIMVSHLFRTLPLLWRLGLLAGGWILALLLVLKALPERRERSLSVVKTDFPSPALQKMLESQEALDVGFVALDNHARVVLSNPTLGKLLNVREASVNAGLSRALHPDNVHLFKNSFQEVCQSASGTTVLQLRSFDRLQHVHHLRVALTRWKESPVAVIGMLWDISDTEQLRQESQTMKAALHDFHGVFAAEGSGLLDTMRALLELGNLHFKTELGLVAKLDDKGERLEVVQVLAPHEDISRGEIFDPITVSHHKFPRVLAHASFVCCGPEALSPPVHKASRQETFLGAPIYLQRQLYGVLCFASPQDRPEGFSSSEVELVQFIANWLGGEMERRQLIDDFEKRHNQLMEVNASLETLLRNDILTGLFNKMALDDRLAQEIDRSHAYDLPLSVVALAPNNAPNYRSSWGEPAWQNLLEQLAVTIERHARGFDIVARYDESTFIIACPQHDIEAAKAQAEQLQIAIAQISNAHHNFTISIGIVSLNENNSNSEKLLTQAVGACEMAQSHSMASQIIIPGNGL